MAASPDLIALGFSSVVLVSNKHGNVKTEELFYKITSYQIKYL
jgi:hypothetical protein